ncbi:MAG: S24 family peptidase [Rubricoccaceae bacterium]|nr:S24 family peptidase [Rubricoccaceae bacterium]
MSDAQPLNAPQKRVLEYVADSVSRRGTFPSGPRIARQLGLHHSTVYKHLGALADRGFVGVEVEGRRRRFHLTERGRAFGSTALPRLGRIPAGPLLPLEAELDDVVASVHDLVPGLLPGDFLLDVEGDSMIDRGLRPGMTVVVRPNVVPPPGAVCAVWVEGEGGTLKQVYAEGDHVRLVPANPDHPERRVPAHQVRVQGVVRAAIDVQLFR